MSSVGRAVGLINQAIAQLESSACQERAAELRIALDQIEHGIPFARKEAFPSVVFLCHPKALGDLFIAGMERDDWNSHLDELQGACEKAFTELEEEFDSLSDAERLRKGWKHRTPACRRTLAWLVPLRLHPGYERGLLRQRRVPRGLGGEGAERIYPHKTYFSPGMSLT